MIYKEAENFVMGGETYGVESFNNVLNIFRSKRLVYSDDVYRGRINLTILHWNEGGPKSHHVGDCNFANNVWHLLISTFLSEGFPGFLSSK